MLHIEFATATVNHYSGVGLEPARRSLEKITGIAATETGEQSRRYGYRLTTIDFTARRPPNPCMEQHDSCPRIFTGLEKEP
ncbi:unnamed protein product [Zymoseptoria tritici ST99CH_3D7]|uniref:Uncharacterized protein n=1 Tax=Zymoseptoria tritici (strain ST99CH_3D7) TaxID=1276538 RepID=A0A1X7S3Q6_ZYMT9|nr:unnamed protein product [Zymoseptoria tritici ST99CH_3D7]